MPIILLIIIVVVVYIWNVSEKAKARKFHNQQLKIANEAANGILLEKINGVLPAFRAAESTICSRLDKFDSGYFTNHEFTTWKNSVSELHRIVAGKSLVNIGLGRNDLHTINSLKDFYKDGHLYRDDYNTKFVKHELAAYRSFFDDVEGRALDFQQRSAIITDEDNNIVIAGAGSGKTTTIVGKVNYILHRYKIDPREILLISFTKKSASTLSKRINIPGIDVQTFHKFSLDVIAATENRQPSIFDEQQYPSLIGSFFQELLSEPDYLNKTASFFIDFLKPEKPVDEFKNQGEYFQYLKDQNFSTYKLNSFSNQGKETFKREIVKSIEECKIANFLLFNNIPYLYEAPYAHETSTKDHKQYKPDFTISVNGKKVYLEHFGISKNGQVPHFFADVEKGESAEQATARYVDGMKWKREIHAKYGTCLVETYSHEMYDNILYENLSRKLGDAGIRLTPKTPGEMWEIILDAAKDEVEGAIKLFQTFITLMKSNNYSSQDVEGKNNMLESKYARKRNKLFLELVEPIYARYEKYLAERHEIDFSDMINKATQEISDRRYDRKFRYIIIDEFQDISIGRYKLVKALKDANPGCRLFCVGDDWQSIYRFAGSDISLFKDFKKYFGATEASKIETTYRFKNPILKISSQFILKNSNQTIKRLSPVNDATPTRHKIVYSDLGFLDDDTDGLIEIFRELRTVQDIGHKEVLILGRYTADFRRIKNSDHFFELDKAEQILSYSFRTEKQLHTRISARFLTVHQAKGLEADIVIVINCNSGKYGFPSGMSDDHVLNLLLSDADQFENGEERRLFYVALTRAKEMVYLIADRYSKSKFITELETEVHDNGIKKCPRCVTADLVKKSGVSNGKTWAFWGCSNYSYGCDHVEWITSFEKNFMKK